MPWERWASPEEAEEWEVSNLADLDYTCMGSRNGSQNRVTGLKNIWFEISLMR